MRKRLLKYCLNIVQNQSLYFKSKTLKSHFLKTTLKIVIYTQNREYLMNGQSKFQENICKAKITIKYGDLLTKYNVIYLEIEVLGCDNDENFLKPWMRYYKTSFDTQRNLYLQRVGTSRNKRSDMGLENYQNTPCRYHI